MKTSIWSKQFWKAGIERAVKTFAQACVAFLAAGATGLIEVDWVQLASVSGLAALVSVLTSIGSGAVTDGSPSLSVEKID
ncbi:holin [Paramicrobacterium chengjingii]|uniref:holin n=1 Tax=Paramicrobacterium chengjingii TaxID=2769067 RepID=UPI001AB0628F|nr:holin [Microbacterium chengjingii]